MTHISRPFQIVLLATALFAAVWFVALRGHSKSTLSAGSSASAPAVSTPAKAAKLSSASHHASAPGVEGLTRAINKAHAVVARSQQNARQLKEKAAQASGSGASQVSSSSAKQRSATSSQARSKAAGSKTAGSKAASSKAAVSPSTVRPAGSSAKAPLTTNKLQTSIEGQLKQGKTVAILFWNPKSSVDTTVRRELQAAEQQLGGTLAVHVAPSSQVGSFGSFTRAVQVYSTPTILLVNKKGETTMLTGLTDSFSLKQAVAESRHAK